MCLLIVATGLDPEYPVLVASNRDEERARRASPPGLWVGERHRVLSPRDRRAGGTWIGINDVGMFAGLTNVAGAAAIEQARSRGHLPHIALDQDGVAPAVDAVLAALEEDVFNAFQLLVTDGRETAIVEHRAGATGTVYPEQSVVVLSNEHRAGELRIPAIETALAPGLGVEERLDALAPILLDPGRDGGHAILKKGEHYGTTSSSLIAVPRDDPRRLVWRFAGGPPDEAEYRNYGNLGRRLVDAAEA